MTNLNVPLEFSFNEPVDGKIFLTRLNDGKRFSAKTMYWVEWNEDRTLKEIHQDPQIGYSLLIDPYFGSFTWLTTPVVSIIEDLALNFFRVIRFQTENSEYVLSVAGVFDSN